MGEGGVSDDTACNGICTYRVPFKRAMACCACCSLKWVCGACLGGNGKGGGEAHMQRHTLLERTCSINCLVCHRQVTMTTRPVVLAL